MTDEVSRFNIESIEDHLLEFQTDVEEINEVVSEFMRCIKEQDKDTFLQLFYHDNTPWLGKFDRESEEIAKGTNPDVVNHFGVFDISRDTFINSMVTPPRALHFEERLTNLKIDTDGFVASASFDYSLLVNESRIKGGREFWQLIKTTHGWRIVSVIHSIKF
ncbi:hypothetical protein [Ekhidna sp.]|uniref:hypothetical protein n=1 Tax=Ekhidna sp. TaxID=2608089 RepID=UPI0032973450